MRRSGELLDVDRRGVPCSGPDRPVVTVAPSQELKACAESGWFRGRQGPPLHRLRAEPGEHD